MKKIAYLLLFFALNACFRQSTVDYYEKQFYGKWYVDEVYLAERKRKIPQNEFCDSVIEFQADGSLRVLKESKETKGNWRTKNVSFDISYTDSTGSKSKSESNLILSLVTENTGFIKLNILAEVRFWKNQLTLTDHVKNKVIVYKLRKYNKD